MMRRAFSAIAFLSGFVVTSVLATTPASAEPPVAPAAPPEPGLPPAPAASPAAQMPAAPPFLPPGAPGPVVFQAGALEHPPPPPPGAFIYWPMCGDAPCPVGGGGVWVHYPAGLPNAPPGGYLHEVPPPKPKGSSMRSVGIMVAGISLSAVSSVGMLIGLMIQTSGDDEKTIHEVAGGVGVAGILAGIPLMVLGGQEKPKEEIAPSSDQTTSYVPAIGLGAGSAQLTWQF